MAMDSPKTYKEFTRENVKTAVKGVKRPKYFAECLGVPRSKLQTFSENNFLDHAVSYFMDNDPLASWRRIIVVLDGIDEKETVNEIRDRAEAIRDTTLTVKNLVSVMKSVEKWYDLGSYDYGLVIPRPVRIGIRESAGLTNEDKKEKLLLYYLKYVPVASWENVAGALFYRSENEALQAVKKYLTYQEPSLTQKNLLTVLEMVNECEWELLGGYINFPASALEMIRKQCSSDDKKCIEILVTSFVSEHPAPSWKLVARALYTIAWYHNDDSFLRALLLLKQQFLIVSSEDAESFVQSMLQKEGTFKQRNMVVILTGLMEAGKTTLLHCLFGKKLPWEYSSTGVAERSWRGITQFSLDINTFKLLENMQDIFEQVVKVYKRRRSIEDVHKEDTLAKEDLNAVPEPTTTIKNAILDEPKTSFTRQGSDNIVNGANKTEKSHSFREMVEKVRMNPEEFYGELELVHMVDTGGQPECLEVMPSLIHNANFVLLVVNLSRGLDEYTTPTFHKGGRKFTKKCLLNSNKEIIEQLGLTMAAQTEAGSEPKILIVATHKDKVKEESVKEKVDDLANNIFPSHLLYTKSKLQTVFDVNLLDCDKKIIRKIRQTLSDEVKERKILHLPPSFVMFEYEAAIQMSKIKETLKRKVDVMTLEECVEVGGKLYMSEKVVEAALEYFHKNNVFLFFKGIGPGLIFLDPKVLINFVNAVVRFSYMALGGDEHEDNVDEDDDGRNLIPLLTRSERESLSKGIITEKLVQGRYLSDNFAPDVFEASNAIQIFEKLYIIAKVSHKIGREPEYLMTCLLPRLSSKELQLKTEPLTAMNKYVSPLIIDFGMGTPPNWELWCSPCGSFGSTIACLISKFNWRISTNPNGTEPICLFHNMVMLHPCEMDLEVTLVNKTKHFIVYVNKNKVEFKNLSKIRNEIVEAVKMVLETMRIKLTVAEGFECPLGTCHTQYIKSTATEVYIVCKNGHKQTFGIETEQGIVVLPDLVKLSKTLNILDRSAVKRRNIGILLLNDHSGATVENILETEKNPAKAVEKIYERWIATCEDHSWKKLIQCFRSVELNSLAKDLEQHFGLPSPSSPGKPNVKKLLPTKSEEESSCDNPGGEVSENLLNLKPQGETHGERVTEQEEPDTDQHEQRVKKKNERKKSATAPINHGKCREHRNRT